MRFAIVGTGPSRGETESRGDRRRDDGLGTCRDEANGGDDGLGTCRDEANGVLVGSGRLERGGTNGANLDHGPAASKNVRPVIWFFNRISTTFTFKNLHTILKKH